MIGHLPLLLDVELNLPFDLLHTLDRPNVIDPVRLLMIDPILNPIHDTIPIGLLVLYIESDLFLSPRLPRCLLMMMLKHVDVLIIARFHSHHSLLVNIVFGTNQLFI
jgi:hypothetical protein